jgi:hypothetical protein
VVALLELVAQEVVVMVLHLQAKLVLVELQILVVVLAVGQTQVLAEQAAPA